ncbi:MAG: hypothetical protein U0S50_14925 [Sphingopyxis sp.]|uniref:hypothetical protein n=1 Tax=Sphingopyxis sp. TaxID=1908224 RepID=UPI002ABC73F3|nr:hypothetical protein [Sphingopyxis sp.]MDZ3833091.1 hypothetical protein [Sphingopyxis sp.]
MEYSEASLSAAHRHSSRHRAELERSDRCGCFHCGAGFAFDAITEWIADEAGSALCPHCGIDAVLGSASGYPVGDPAFLAAMRRRWFG